MDFKHLLGEDNIIFSYHTQVIHSCSLNDRSSEIALCLPSAVVISGVIKDCAGTYDILLDTDTETPIQTPRVVNRAPPLQLVVVVITLSLPVKIIVKYMIEWTSPSC